MHVIVVDDDETESARAIVESFSDRSITIHCTVEPRRNISWARNRAVGLASAGFVAMIDDDEWAEPTWLAALLETALRYEADVVFGPVLRVFAEDAPAHIRECGTFLHPDPQSGATEGFVPSTGNCLLRRRLMAGQPQPFDPRLGLTGGEDTHLFARLRAEGQRSVWCREARVREEVAPERARVGWVLRREFRNGTIYRRAHAPLRDSGRHVWMPTPGSSAVRVYRRGKAALRLALRRRRDLALARARAMAFHLGILANFMHVDYQEYG